MNLESFVTNALREGASDLHLEPGIPAALRVRGQLKTMGEPVPGEILVSIAKSLLRPDEWQDFLARRSADLSKTIHGVRCRINVLHTLRGIGLAVRLLGWFQPTIETLNLHPGLAKLVRHKHGLILVSGATGSGKSSTLAALIHEVNVHEACHIVTLEQPVEFLFRPRKSLIRQREVGRDTPSFQQGILDAMREDPDVLIVGEMREPATIQLTLNAAETGHLVLTTVHSATVSEALHRVVAAFPAEIQPMVCAQLADCLQAVICQTLRFHDDIGIRVPECEVLHATTPVKAMIRQGHFHKLTTALETGGKDGQFTRHRYRAWVEQRQRFHVADPSRPELPEEQGDERALRPVVAAASPTVPHVGRSAVRGSSVDDDDDVIVIQPPTESLSDILDELNNS